jgi:hypothetical protein
MADKPYEMKDLAGETQHQDLLRALADAEIEVKRLSFEKPPKMTGEEAQLANTLLASAGELITALKKDYEARDFGEMGDRVDRWLAAHTKHFARIAEITQSRFALLPFNDLPSLIRAIKREASKLG